MIIGTLNSIKKKKYHIKALEKTIEKHKNSPIFDIFNMMSQKIKKNNRKNKNILTFRRRNLGITLQKLR